MTGKEPSASQDFVYALAASPRFGQDGICFAGRPSGLYRSEDGGLTWEDAYRSQELQAPLPTAAVAVASGEARSGELAQRGPEAVFAGVPGGILRSADAGRTWTAVRLPSPPPFVVGLAVSPHFAQDGVILAATMEDGIFRSGDRGASWAAWNFGLLDLSVLSLALSPAFGQDETAFAGTDSGLYRSTNGGRAWREVGFPDELAPVTSLALSPDYPRDGTLWAGTDQAGLYRSGDWGKTWTRLGGEAIQGAVNALVAARGAAGPAVMVLAGNGLFLSGDGGDLWSRWKPSLPAACELTAVAAPQGLDAGAPVLVGSADGSVYRVEV